jgi:LmbE family N-acetylglucosaminyl deacetylase
MLEMGVHVRCIAFSTCEESVPDGYPRDILGIEFAKSMNSLGVSDYETLTYRVRHFPRHRQDVLERLVKTRIDYEPDVVFLPSSTDIHQDHQVISREGLRAFKFCTVLGYEVPPNTTEFKHVAFVQLEEQHIQAKIRGMGCYESQAQHAYHAESFVRGLARVRGVQSNAQYAEAFEVIKWLT